MAVSVNPARMSWPIQSLVQPSKELNTMAENAAAKQRRRGRGRPFERGQSGNPAGKPPGTRHKATLAAEVLLDGESEKLARKAITMALEGDTTAMRLCLERILPPRRDRPVSFALPRLGGAGDAARMMAAITTAVASGGLTLSEAGDLSSLVSGYVKAIEIDDLEKRIAALEQRASTTEWR
jgi:Family of unknown function (DUF5681)